MQRAHSGSTSASRVEVIPAILAKDAIEFVQKLRTVEGAVQTVQVDVLDGSMVPFTSYAVGRDMATVATPTEYELHLMVNDPRRVITEWLSVPTLRRAIVHAEIPHALPPLLAWIKEHRLEVGVALNPETSEKVLAPLLPLLDCVLILGVHPGRSGQAMLPGTIEKVQRVRAMAPHMPIEVDGGVTTLNAPALLDAGATRLAVGSGIFRSRKPKTAIKGLLGV